MDKNKELYKYYYDYWKNTGWNTNKLITLATPELTIEDIRKNAKIYASKYLNQTEDEFYKEIEKIRNTNSKAFYISQRLFKAYEQISDTNNEEEIIKILDNCDTTIKDIEKKLIEYISFYRKNEKHTLLIKMKNKINIYKKYLNEKQIPSTKSVNIEEAINGITTFIKSPEKEKSTFCENNNLDQNLFNEYLDVVRQNYPKTYNSYLKKIKTTTEEEYQHLIKQLPKIINYIKNGVPTPNNKTLKFTLLDYYLITSINYENLKDIAEKEYQKNNITLEERNEVMHFVTKHKNEQQCSERQKQVLINEKITVNSEFNEDGEYIEGSGITPTKEEKEYILNFLEENNIPVTRSIFSNAVQKYADKTLIKQQKNRK